MHTHPMLPRKTSRQDSIPVWGWWVIGSVIALIFLVWFFLSGASSVVADATTEFLSALMRFLVIPLLIGIYFLPTIIAAKSPRAAAVFLTNLFFGWTGIGWIVALIWAVAESGTMNARKTPPPYR